MAATELLRYSETEHPNNVEKASSSSVDSSVFLTAEWRHLVMLNYEVDPAILRRFVPGGTELDTWHGKTFISLVGFRFLNTRIRFLRKMGISIPFHRNFDEVNLRFYVRRLHAGEIRRGVVFIREFVPRAAIAFIARAFYNERYSATPMTHQISTDTTASKVEYRWKSKSGWNALSLTSNAASVAPEEGTLPQFITEHYWGYSRSRDGSSVEYQVEHPAWRVRNAHTSAFDGNARELYGAEFADPLSGPPASALLAEGSEVKVFRGRRL
ncbi:MAG: DUF2071 domain-containing protein [Acidobacteriales bacterium]|nr:DUF2071 domain-containing protein [Terriglobales bacterium]